MDAKSKKQDEIKKLVLANLDQIKLTATALTAPGGGEGRELWADGYFGLLAAARRFDPVRWPKIPFKIFARRRIRWAMINGRRQTTEAPLPAAIVARCPAADDQGFRQMIRPLGRKHRLILLLRYEADLDFSAIGQALGVAAKRASALHGEAVRTLRRNFSASSERSNCHDG